MECSFIMDNDSGYVSHNQESNLDSSSENVFKTRSCSSNIYLSEDALLEQPLVENTDSSTHHKHYDSFDSVINNSQESVKTEFSGFEDSDTSLVIPTVGPIVWNSNEEKEASPISVNLKESSVDTSAKPKALSNVTNTYDQNTNQAVMKNASSDKENIRPSETPKKHYTNPQTSDMSPDLFAEEEAALNASFKVKSPMIKKGTPKENHSIKDTKLLRNVQGSLTGVHPPPSVTMIQMGVVEMLERIEKNKDMFWKGSSTVTSETVKSLLVDDKPECVHQNWPIILNRRFHGLHYNRNKISEDLEHLCLKFAERYVGAETQSSCTIFESNPCSSQKRKMVKPRWSMKSPGRRLSHLARRRITFSSSSLQAGSSSAVLGSRTRQILVDARKLSMGKKSPRKTPKKTPSKSPFKIRKNTPSSSAKKKLAMRFRQMSGEFENVVPSTSFDQAGPSFKRALFTENESVSFGGSIEKKSTKRALFPSPMKHSPNKKSPLKTGALDKKRKRTDSDLCNPPKLARSASSGTQSTRSESGLSNRTLDSFVSKPEELSDLHIKKLQWAVYESLRLQNVTPTHPQYKVFASVLARVTRRFLPNLRSEGRTSEKMLRIARHHSYAVVKGKTVDEIVNEFVKNKMRNQKPQGYIGIEEYNRLRSSRDEGFVNKENVLQDKANIIESIEKRREHAGSKTRYVHQNRIDQIKKVICFEEKET